MVKFSPFIILLFSSFAVNAQRPVVYKTTYSNDVYSNIEKKQIKYLNELYSLKIDPTLVLINGRDHFPYFYRSNFKPILFIDKKHSSSITLKGKEYNDIDLNYDTYLDEVIYIDSTRAFIYMPFEVALNKDNVDCFKFYYINDTITFKYYSNEASPDFNLQDGYYEVVYDGECKYIVRHKSTTFKSSGVKEYLYNPVGYVKVGNGFLKIKSKGQFLRLFGDRSSLVRKYMKGSGISIRNADKMQIKNVLRFYDNLKTPIN